MSREEKAQVIDDLANTIAESSIGILTDYRGLTANELNVLRRKLREANVEYKVVKNTLARFAGEKAGMKNLVGLFEGPVALAFGQGEISEPAKVLNDYIKDTKAALTIKGGFITDRILTASDVETLAELPPKEILIAKLLGNMQGPIAGFVRCLNTPLQGFVRILQARIDQMEEK